MNIEVPSVEAVREALAGLTLKQIERLGELSGVPWSTIYKIKRGETRDPGMDTCGRFMPHVDVARGASDASGVEPEARAA